MKKIRKHNKCRYRFMKWLISQAVVHEKLYWLIWGMLMVLAICAWRFGLAWLI